MYELNVINRFINFTKARYQNNFKLVHPTALEQAIQIFTGPDWE